MSLPYRWRPLGTDRRRVESRLPEYQLRVGHVVAFEHAVFRVVALNRRDEVDVKDGRCWAVVLRPATLDPDAAAVKGDRHLGASPSAEFHVYPDAEHRMVCACCSEPYPCRSLMAIEVAEAAAAEAARYETPGVCPACREPITLRQRAHTMPTLTPTGPPVTFHLRAKCHYEAVMYERKVKAAYPAWRSELSCEGSVTRHGDGTFDCTAMSACPGATANHNSYQVCGCEDCFALAGRFGCHPHPTDRRREDAA